MPFTHVGGVAGKSGTIAMQQKIGKLRKRIAELEQVVVERNQRIRQLRTENKKLREMVEDMLSCIEICSAFNRPPTTKMYEEFAQQARKLGIEVDK